MKRVQKNKKLYRKNNKIIIESIIAWGLVFILKMVYKIVGFILKIMYIIINRINTLFGKLFMKLPRLLKVITVYSLIGYAVFTTYNPKVTTIIKEVQRESAININIADSEYDDSEENKKCLIGEIECKIYNKATQEGLTHKQALLIISITKHETGNYTSSAFKNKHNLGGIMCSTGLKNYNSLDDGIEAMVLLLKNRYFEKGLDTIEKIGNVYCPVGAKNDPNGLNKNWIPRVTQIFYELDSKY